MPTAARPRPSPRRAPRPPRRTGRRSCWLGRSVSRARTRRPRRCPCHAATSAPRGAQDVGRGVGGVVADDVGEAEQVAVAGALVGAGSSRRPQRDLVPQQPRLGALARKLEQERLVDPRAVMLDVGLEEHARARARGATQDLLGGVEEPSAPAQRVSMSELVEVRQRGEDRGVGRQGVIAQPFERAALVYDAPRHDFRRAAWSGWFCATPW